MEDICEYRLPNGIRVVHKTVSTTKVAHCGFILDIGSRDEKPDQLGMAHFWEHMAFKGTKKRKAFHVINRLESLGGELNAYTTKEKICFYASFLDHHYEKALELLKDITFDSIFPEHQIERERNVILEEIAMYQDSPDDAIQDEFDSLVFWEHPLGTNILGTTESVKTFTRKDFQQFIQENINTEQIIFSSVGNIPFSRVKRLAEKYIGTVPPLNGTKERVAFQNYRPQTRQSSYPTSQAYCAMGRPVYSLHHPKRLAFFLINNLVGGPGLNSRLNLSLREKYGYVYSVESHYHPFVDTGLFAVFFATESKHLSRSIFLVKKTLGQLRKQRLGVIQLHQAKEQLMGQMAMAEESNLNFMLMMGKSLLDSGSIPSFEEITQAISQIDASVLQEIAEELFYENDFSILTYVPENIKS